MRTLLLVPLVLALPAFAQTPPLLPQKSVAALANELSGETAKRNLEGLARFHRQRGSRGFHAAAELIAERARAYGLSDVAILRFPADGKIFYGTQRSRQAWDADEGELVEIKDGTEVKLASYAAEPVVLAEDSESADVTADLIDVGDGTRETDYAGKDVKGKIVLVGAAAGSVQDVAVGKFGAAGIISYAQLARPARTIRFIWPPEVEGTVTLLNAKPEFAQNIKAAIHMDMVGGGPETQAVFHVTRGPMSLPSFVHDVAWAFASWVNDESYRFAAGEKADYPLIAPEGGKEPLRAEYSAYTMGSDHDLYQDSSFGIPTIYLNDWPDRYIHTNFDTAANIDPTKLKRAAFIGAASGYFLANLDRAQVEATNRFVTVGKLLRTATATERGQTDPTATAILDEYEKGVSASLTHFYERRPHESSTHRRREPQYSRRSDLHGPLMVFGYDYFADHAKVAGIPTPRLLSYAGKWGLGGSTTNPRRNRADAGQYCSVP
jgi:hypothetical protein